MVQAVQGKQRGTDIRSKNPFTRGETQRISRHFKPAAHRVGHPTRLSFLHSTGNATVNLGLAMFLGQKQKAGRCGPAQTLADYAKPYWR